MEVSIISSVMHVSKASSLTPEPLFFITALHDFSIA